tara:strand:- start:22780 stop:23889 length:1110 start_codon:yes stop_codon:yes gene_type:complete
MNKSLYNEEKKKKLFENCVFLKVENNKNNVEYFFLDKENLYPVSNISLTKNNNSNIFNVSGSYSESGYGKLLYLMALMDLTKNKFFMSSSYDGSMRGKTIDIWNQFIFSNDVDSNFNPESDFEECLLELLFDNEDYFIKKYGLEKISALEEIDNNELMNFLEKNNMVLNNVYLKCQKSPDEFYSLMKNHSDNILKNKKYDIELIKSIASESFTVYYEDDNAQINMSENKTFKINNFYNYFEKENTNIYLIENKNNSKLTITDKKDNILFYSNIFKDKKSGLAYLEDFFSKKEYINLSEELFHFILISDENGCILMNDKYKDLEKEYEIKDYPMVLSVINRSIIKEESSKVLEKENNLFKSKRSKQKVKI